MVETKYSTPGPMPIDVGSWAQQLNLSNFVNTYCQYRDLALCENSKTLLIIGKGQGLDAEVLRWRGYSVTTFDIDPILTPDVQGSVHDLHAFAEKQFDVVIVSHVLEHLPLAFLDDALREIARVARYALVYLPVAGRHGQFRLKLGVLNLGLDLVWDLFNYFERPDGINPKYCAGQHYWEVGLRGFAVSDLKKRFSNNYKVIGAYRNKEWLPSYNFILKSH